MKRVVGPLIALLVGIVYVHYRATSITPSFEYVSIYPVALF